MCRSDVEERVFACCTAQGFFSPGSRVTVAVSGGADSMALLTVLLSLRERLGIAVSAAHFHHGLRGDAADRDADFVERWCGERGIPLTVGRGDTRTRAEKTGESLEEAARALRYAFFDTLDADRIATAHTADDNVETVLLHLVRGTGLRGLAGIPPQRGRYVRPLLGCTRAEIEAYLQQTGTPHVEDATNADDGCLRNRLRHRVLPLLRAENPALTETVSRTGEILRQEDACLSALARQAAERCRDGDGWRCAALGGLDPVLQGRIFLGILRDLGLAHVERVQVEALQALLTARPGASRTLPEGWIALREQDRLVILRENGRESCPERLLKIPGDTDLSEIGLRIRAKVTENSNFAHKNRSTFVLRYDMIAAASWSVRARRPGDTLLLPAGHRSLKRLMIDRRVPASQRGRLPVVLFGGQIAGVPGLAISEDFRPLPGEPVLELTLLPLEPSQSRQPQGCDPRRF